MPDNANDISEFKVTLEADIKELRQMALEALAAIRSKLDEQGRYTIEAAKKVVAEQKEMYLENIKAYKNSAEKQKENRLKLLEMELTSLELERQAREETTIDMETLEKNYNRKMLQERDEFLQKEGTLYERAKLALTEGYRKYKEQLAKESDGFPFSKETMKGIEDSLGSGLGEALGSVINQTKSAKAAFKDMGDAVVNDIGRIVTRMMAMQAVQLMFGGIGMLFAEGGVMPGKFMPITPMAEGGLYRRPTLGLVAEAGTPEAVVPLKGGGVPVRFVGDAPRAQQQKPTYIVNAFSEEFMQQQVNKALASNAEVILNMVQSDIMQGGSTYQLIRGLR
jgi:hypothetical protein